MFDWGVHPLMVPSNVANRKIDGHPWTWNSLVVDAFQTMPVGKPGPFAPVGESGPFPAVGINTLSPCATPAALYRVDHPELLSLTHQGEPGACTSLHPFTRRGLLCRAALIWFEFRFVS